MHEVHEIIRYTMLRNEIKFFLIALSVIHIHRNIVDCTHSNI